MYVFNLFFKLLPSNLYFIYESKIIDLLKTISSSFEPNNKYNKFLYDESLSLLYRQIAQAISSSNQVHYLAPLIASCPILKKDIFYRQVYHSYEEALFAIKYFYQNEKELFKLAKSLIIKNSFSGSGAGILKRLLIANGYI